MYLGSDAIALAPFTDTDQLSGGRRLGGAHAQGRRDPRRAWTARSSAPIAEIARPRRTWSTRAIISHFMAKEIHEQPEVVGHTLAHYIDMATERVALPDDAAVRLATKLKRMSISACGTAYYAGLVAKYWFERFARLPVEIDIASEFRYREAPLEPGDLAHLHLAVGRDRRHAGDACATPKSNGSTCCPWSTCRPRPSRAKATW